MKTTEIIRVAVADSSMIVRNGVIAILKRLTDLRVKPVEVASPEALENCLHIDTPDILLVNPIFGGWFNLDEFKADEVHCSVKCIAINCHIMDNSILQSYDECITLYEDMDSFRNKILRVLEIQDEAESDTISETESLSAREKEIVAYVVKGLTNKEIAEKLYLSVHTVITHRRNIAKKLEIRSVAGLTIYAIVNKLVELNEVKL